MNFRQLRYFVAAFEEGGFSAAALKENCSQPALSAQIKSLEQHLGSSLFRRTASGVVPTIAGEKFYEMAINILKSVATAEIKMRETAKTVTGVVRAGLVPSVARGLVPNLLAGFLNDYPEIRLSIIQGYSATLTHSVAARDLDFAFVIEPPEITGLEMTTISHEDIVLVSGKSSDMEPWAPINLAQHSPLKLVMPTIHNSLGQSLRQLVQLGQIRAEQILEIDAMSATIDFVRSGHWATILPATAILRDIERKDLIFNPISNPVIHSDFFLVHRTRQPLSPASRIFVATVREAIETSKKKWHEKTYKSRAQSSSDNKITYTKPL